ncbi:MAG: hypothetical protein V4819_14685 [Verrucomicrobiota bacterium]
MPRLISIAGLILVFIMIAMLAWVSNRLDTIKQRLPTKPAQSQIQPVLPAAPTASESLLTGFGDSATSPIEDLRKIQHVAVGYFSVVKDTQHFPIGGNQDFSAALRGENPNREIFLRADHPVFSREGLLIDRWGSPLIVHPEAWRELELRSAGPDRIAYNDDDLILSPTGTSSRAK